MDRKGKALGVLGIWLAGLNGVYGDSRAIDRETSDQLIPILIQLTRNQDLIAESRIKKVQAREFEIQAEDLRKQISQSLVPNENSSDQDFMSLVKALRGPNRDLAQTFGIQALEFQMHALESSAQAQDFQAQALESQEAALKHLGAKPRLTKPLNLKAQDFRAKALEDRAQAFGYQAKISELRGCDKHVRALDLQAQTEKSRARDLKNEVRPKLNKNRSDFESILKPQFNSLLQNPRELIPELDQPIDEILELFSKILSDLPQFRIQVLVDQVQTIYGTLFSDWDQAQILPLKTTINQNLENRLRNQSIDQKEVQALRRILIPKPCNRLEEELLNLIIAGNEKMNKSKRISKIREILEDSDLDVNFQDDKGRTFLMHAATLMEQKIIKLLLSREDTDHTLTDDEGRDLQYHISGDAYIHIREFLDAKKITH